jgi:hypothetical protein
MVQRQFGRREAEGGAGIVGKMRKPIIQLPILLTALLGAAMTFFFVKEQQKKRELRLLLPRSDMLRSPDINDRLAKVNLPSLRTVLMPGGNFEVRVWIGFGLNGTDCLILRYFSGQWLALHLQGTAEAPPFPNSLATLSSPKSGWNKAWQRLVDAGILTLPDALEVKCFPGVLDGIGYVVESNINMTYRTYSYSNPWYDKPPWYKRCKEAKQMILIGKIIGEEFGLKGFDLSDIQ